MTRITIACTQCESSKLPLETCETCGAEPGVDEMSAWRRRLRAHHTAMILARPRPRIDAIPVPLPRPLHVVVDLRDIMNATETLIVPDTVALPPNPLSFDWDDSRRLRKLRRSA